MSTGATAPRDPRSSAVPMGVLLAAGAAASAVSTPPVHERARQRAAGREKPAGPAGPACAEAAADGRGPGGRHEQAAPEPEAA
ncbi:hypothetical protein ACFV7Q_13865 [Streptomyces sp. NPDC059851]|uniref:hypothetical protein n=1 Tax=Streptomyces sp. NPDC059851 TaxID=3346971 RepID=UPI003666DB14